MTQEALRLLGSPNSELRNKRPELRTRVRFNHLTRNSQDVIDLGGGPRAPRIELWTPENTRMFREEWGRPTSHEELDSSYRKFGEVTSHLGVHYLEGRISPEEFHARWGHERLKQHARVARFFVHPDVPPIEHLFDYGPNKDELHPALPDTSNQEAWLGADLRHLAHSGSMPRNSS